MFDHATRLKANQCLVRHLARSRRAAERADLAYGYLAWFLGLQANEPIMPRLGYAVCRDIARRSVLETRFGDTEVVQGLLTWRLITETDWENQFVLFHDSYGNRRQFAIGLCTS